MTQKNKFIDPSTLRKNRGVESNLRLIHGLPVFSIIELNIYGDCNRKCGFCPVSNPNVYLSKKEGISQELYSDIVKQLVDLDYDGKILFSAFCEPFLHRQLNDLIRTSKVHLPKCHIEIVSNGDLFVKKPEILKEAFRSGLDTICISLYDGPKQMEVFGDLTRSLGLSSEQVLLRRRYFEGGNFGMTISNRAGLIDSNEFRDGAEEEIVELPLNKVCFYPFYQILVDYNGDVLLCPHDWEKKLIIGNLSKHHIWDLWAGSNYNRVRTKLSHADRRFIPCKKCDVHGDIIGRRSFDSWRKIDGKT